jgi:hypothetical protein
MERKSLQFHSIFMEEVERIFNLFCAFGSARGKSATPEAVVPATTMDNQRFAKFCKDCRVIRDKITLTDVDIIFNKVKTKNARRIELPQFEEAIRMLANIQYADVDKEDAFSRLLAEISKSGGAPKLEAGSTHVVNNDITKRLTDHTQYTGTHKNRFDEQGKGLGVQGRDRPDPKELSQITNRKEANVRGVQI